MTHPAVTVWPFCDIATRQEYPQFSPEGTPWAPSATAGVKGTPADLDNARTLFPERTEDEWMALFDRAPHIWTDLLGDIFREVRAQEQRESGNARIGRRPKAIQGTMAELEAMVTPRFADEPFAVAVRELIGNRSLRAFAARVPMNHHTLTRMMRGELKLDPWRLAAIAKAGRVSPAFFVEYRQAEVMHAVEVVLAAKPHFAVRVHRELANAAGR